MKRTEVGDEMKRMMMIGIALIFIVVGCQAEKIEPNTEARPVKDFEFTSEKGKTIAKDDLKGDWWVAYFMYTHCTTVCPQTTAHLVNMQETLQEDDIHPRIVSFSVDPDYDNEKRLKAYAKEYDADTAHWDFLTGYDFKTIKQFSIESFKAMLSEGAADQRAHSYYFYLINPDGEMVKKYDGLSVDEVDVLTEDLKKVM